MTGYSIMRIVGKLWGVAVLGFLPTVMVGAQESPPAPLPDQGKGGYESTAPAAAGEKTAAPAAGVCQDVAGPACDDGCGQTACTECSELFSCNDGGSQPWTLPQPSFLQKNRIKMGGWLQQGITFNNKNPVDDYNGPVATNDLDTEYQMNQLWLYFVRPVNTDDGGWDIGGRIDMLYGSDFRFGVNHGLENNINDLDQNYGMVIPQMYLEVAVDKLSVKVGHFAGILDYEVIPAPANPFYSHSYSYGYTVPQLVTGIMGDYKLTDQLSVQACLHRGWMMFEDTNDTLDFMGGVKWVSADKKTSVAYALSVGPQDPPAIVNGVPIADWDGTPGNQDRFVYSLVCQHQFTDQFKYVLVHNLGLEDNALPPGQNAEWYGLNQYFLYQINPKWSANLRFEWMRDDDGARIAGPGNVPGIRAWNGAGFAGNFFNCTVGANWRPLPSLVVRPELRWDRYDGPASFLRGNMPFGAGTGRDQLTFAVDAVLMF